MQLEVNIPERGLAHVDIDGARITAVEMLDGVGDGTPLASPGFVDLQVNGFAGIDFSDGCLEPEAAISVLPHLWRTGVTTFCPTLVTNSYERLDRNFRVLERARQIDVRLAQVVPCYHLEGPYISPNNGARGAHDVRQVRPPSWDEFCKLQEAAGGRIGILTLAPEHPGALEFIRRVSGTGVLVAIGHTDAAPDEIHRAVDAGARLSTHFGNGCPALMHRHLSPLWAQLALDELCVSLICDGFHLPTDLLTVVLRLKGIDRCVLITDAVRAAGMPPGQFTLGDVAIELLPSGQVVTLDHSMMAGSALTMNRAVPVFMRLAGASLEEALQAATANPARLLGKALACSHVQAGQPANLVLFQPDNDCLRVNRVFLQGEEVYRAS